MRKRVFGSIFLTAIVTLLLTAGLFLLVVHAGLTRDLRGRLAREGGYIAATVSADCDPEEIKTLGTLCADRITLVKKDGTVLYDNETPAAEMENHGTRPEIRRAAETGVGEDSRLSETLETQTYYYALRLANGNILRIAATADSAFGALASASPWIVLVVLLALLVAALLASRLTHVFLAPIVSLDLHDPLKNEAYDELSPLLHRIDRQNRRINIQMDELRRRQAEFDDITARMDEGLAAGRVGGINGIEQLALLHLVALFKGIAEDLAGDQRIDGVGVRWLQRAAGGEGIGDKAALHRRLLIRRRSGGRLSAAPPDHHAACNGHHQKQR